MRHPRVSSLIVTSLVLLVLNVGAARAQCSDPTRSTFPSHVLVCPSGDVIINCVVLDPSGAACPSHPVRLTFTGAAVSQLWVPTGSTFPNFVELTSAPATGLVQFHPPLGGCAVSGVAEYYDGITGALIGSSPTINSPDIDASGDVGLPDVVMFANAYYTVYDPCADFNMDGVLNLSDLVILASHLGH